MKSFSDLISRLDQTTKTSVKLTHLVNYLEKVSDSDKLWAIAMFTGRRPSRTVKTSLLRVWAAEYADIPHWLVEESYHVVGDLAETIAHILPPPDQNREEKSLTEWIAFLKNMGPMDENEKRSQMLFAWSQLQARERFVFNKLLTGGFRIGVSQRLMVRAIASYTRQEPSAIAHRLMGSWTPDSTTFKELILSENLKDDISRPYPFYLAYQLETPLSELGNPEDWQIEWKWDGIRAQYIRRKGEWFLWSRGEELINEKFPELDALSKVLPDGLVLDGELLAFKDKKPLSFQLLQTRIGRKKISAKILRDAPVVLMVYDLLEIDATDIRNWPLQKRRLYLERLIEKSDYSPYLRLSETIERKSWEEITQIRTIARERACEGLMLKRKEAEYKVGRKKGDWWKWKVDPLTVDAVMIYAQRGHGRRANLYSDYTFAVWDGDRLVPFAKAYSGLTDAEIRQVDSWIKKNTLERFGPVRSVKAELVFELAFEGINRSRRHKSGVAVRFPRMLRWRQDKKPAEADTLETLTSFLQYEQN